MNVTFSDRWVLKRPGTIFLLFVLFSFFASGCLSNNRELAARVLELEQRVNRLESVIAKYQGASAPIDSRQTQGIISSGSGLTDPTEHKDNPSKKGYETYNGRCQATTTKGKQCKRHASSGSDYCWQHH